jgi:hypothetical protein
VGGLSEADGTSSIERESASETPPTFGFCDAGADHEQPFPAIGTGCFSCGPFSPLSHLPARVSFGYDSNMATQNPTDAEVFQRFIAEQVATTGRSKSPEELLRLYRQRQQELADSLEALQEGIADMEAGRVHPFDEVHDEIRREHGWSSNE